MKILCIENSYPNPSAPPVFFMKPNTALVQRNRPVFIPEWTQAVQYEAALVLKICKNGKYIEEQFAHTYYDEIGVGLDFTARDLLNDLIAHGLPWEKAKAFDHSAPVGTFLPKEQFDTQQGIRLSLKKNGTILQSGNSLDIPYSFDHIIAEISQYVTLKQGDLIFIGIASCIGTVQIGDLLEVLVEDRMALRMPVR